MTKNIVELNTIVDEERKEYLRLLDRHEKILISYGKEIRFLRRQVHASAQGSPVLYRYRRKDV